MEAVEASAGLIEVKDWHVQCYHNWGYQIGAQVFDTNRREGIMTVLKWIRMELARDDEFPMGSRNHGYEFVAPLNDDDRVDPEAWKAHRDRCRVKRFWEGEPDEIGHLVRKGPKQWAFHYDIHGDQDDDETGFRFADHRFRPGEYVSIREHNEELKTFRVVVVRDIE
jgi:hypothetical protein